MNKALLAGFFALTLLGGPLSLEAKDKKMTPEEQQEQIQDHLKKLTDDLKLSADQQRQVREILQDKMDKKEKLMQETQSKIRGVLTADQKTKFDEMKADKKTHKKDY